MARYRELWEYTTRRVQDPGNIVNIPAPRRTVEFFIPDTPNEADVVFCTSLHLLAMDPDPHCICAYFVSAVSAFFRELLSKFKLSFSHLGYNVREVKLPSQAESNVIEMDQPLDFSVCLVMLGQLLIPFKIISTLGYSNFMERRISALESIDRGITKCRSTFSDLNSG